MITLAIIIALSFVLLFGASVRRRIKRDRDGGLLDVSCNHCGKWIDASVTECPQSAHRDRTPPNRYNPTLGTRTVRAQRPMRPAYAP